MPQREIDRVYDELLVTLVQSGDRRAIERLAARWQPRLIRAARRLVRDDDIALEAVQETWTGVLAGIAHLADPARFPAWTFRILHHKCVDLIRRAQRRRRQTTALNVAPEPAAPTGGGEDVTAILQALGRLSLDHRSAAVLYFGEGLTMAEIAVATNVPVGTAKSRIFHARRQLKAALAGDDHDRN